VPSSKFPGGKNRTVLQKLQAVKLPEATKDQLAQILEKFRAERQEAEELDEEIKHTDGTIDQIVYALYGLTEEEIAVVEEGMM
jgi:hypothetical protein